MFGEPDIELRDTEDGQVMVDLRGIDRYDPTTSEVRSNDTNQPVHWRRPAEPIGKLSTANEEAGCAGG